ncbi:MAG TPA: hypothetical protein VFQ90_15825, partial [Stellaceae bacterium]|nr:hypothetical protein [Stellaceae bacterium]
MIVVFTGPRLKCRIDNRLGDLVEDMVAAEAARKRLQVEWAKPPEDFHELTMRVGFADEAAVRHGAPLEKTLIASQQNASFAIGQLRERRIVRIIAI